jgi:anti-sigma B factor antagonist
MLELSRDFRAEMSSEGSDSRVVRVAGEIDLVTAPTLRTTLDLACDQARYIVVDMEDVEFIDASGISALVVAANRARERNGELTVQNPSRFVRKVLAILSLDDQFGLPVSAAGLCASNS